MNLNSSGSVTSFVKRVPAGTAWDGAANNLLPSQQAIPMPAPPSVDLPMDRVLHGKVTYDENQGFTISFQTPQGFHLPANILGFGFGGWTDTRDGDGNSAIAGRFYLLVRGSGDCIVYEQTSGGWMQRTVFRWHLGHAPQVHHSISAHPRSRNVLMFQVSDGGGHESLVTSAGAAPPLGPSLLQQPGAPPPDAPAVHSGGQGVQPGQAPSMLLYRPPNHVYPQPYVEIVPTAQLPGAPPGSPPPVVRSPLIKQRAMTGAGPVIVDVPRHLRIPFSITVHQTARSGRLVDLPFVIPFPVPGMTRMILTADSYLPPGCTLTGVIRDARDGSLCAAGGTDPLTGGLVFLTNAGQQAYVVEIDFFANSGQTLSPLLHGYEVRIDSALAARTTTPVVTGRGTSIRDVSISGPDLDPSHDSAHMSIEDPAEALATLRNRGRVPCRVKVLDDTGKLLSVLFQGEVSRATALKKGKKNTDAPYTPSLLRPASEYRHYDLSMVGVWARLAEHVQFSLLHYDQDPVAPPLPNGVRQPWKITDVLRDILWNELGFPPATLDIPDLPLRLWPFPGTSMERLVVQPGSSCGDLLLKLVKDYLGMVLTFDPNAANGGYQGMWRLIANPGPPYANVLASFVGYPDKAHSGPVMTTAPQSYLPGSTFIQRGTFRSWVQAPECNYVLVLGMGAQDPTFSTLTERADPRTLNMASMVNVASNDFPGYPPSDPTSPDYLGRFVPVVHVDPSLISPAACAWVCRRIYEVAAHARNWFGFRAPLILVTDPNDPFQVRSRPLRVNDVAKVYGQKCLVRSVNIAYRSDVAQMADYEMLQIAGF